MTLTCFGKLCKIKSLKARVTRVQLDLLYKRVIQISKVQTMDLNTFFDALEELASQLFPGQLGRCDALIDTVLDELKDLKPVPMPATQDKTYMNITANRRIAKE